MTYYFTTTSLIAFAVVALTLYVLQSMEESFFEKVQREQRAFFAQVQTDFMRRQDASARDDMLRQHEAGHVNLTRVFSNVLWETDFSPFVAKVQQLAIDHCRTIAVDKAAGNAAVQSGVRQACFADVGRKIMSLPGFAALDAKVHATMRESTVFKIKTFDLRGITVYSSEHKQIGEDKADNRGWKTAVGGRPASELTHRNRFSAFEGVVEHRDLISSYIPMRARSGKILGVFEIYSDVTPFLGQIKAASAKVAELTAANQARVEHVARENQGKVNSSSDRFLAIVYGLLALLYVALLLLVRNGQRIIDLQAQAHERAIERETRWHQEKMAALATIAANVAHEVGNPLATISGVAEDIALQQAKTGCPAGQPQLILEQTQRIANMTRRIADFAAAHDETLQAVDVNQMVKAVCDFLNFDRRFRATPIEFRPGAQLPARMVIPDHLNEVLMNLLLACAEGQSGHPAVPGRILVETEAREEDVLIRIGGDSVAADDAEPTTSALPDSRFDAVRRRVVSMGGALSSTGATIEVTLPPSLST